MNDYVVISDLHLGSGVCRADKIHKFLCEIQTKTLILNGDVFDSLDFGRIKKQHWKIIKKLRHLSKKIEVIWLQGNHDTEKADVIANLIGIEFKKQLSIDIGNKKITILHGDVFDEFINKRPIISKIADIFYRTIQSFDRKFTKDFYYSSIIKNKSKELIRCGKVVENAIKYCKRNSIEYIICGHTHMQTQILDKENDIYYYNCGCWTDKTCGYVAINGEKLDLMTY